MNPIPPSAKIAGFKLATVLASSAREPKIKTEKK